mgnify:CR=1 FL=1
MEVLNFDDLRREATVEMKPSGYLPFAEHPGPQDNLILSPSYIIPVDILERGIIHPTRLIRQVVIVDGFDGRTMLLDMEKLMPDTDSEVNNTHKEYLELKISGTLAAEIARSEAVPPDCRGWKKALKNSRVLVSTDEIKLVWRIYSVSDGKVIDTFTGNVIESAGLLGMLFSQAKN